MMVCRPRFLRRVSFDRLRTNGSGPSTGSGRAGGGPSTGFLRQAQDEWGRSFDRLRTNGVGVLRRASFDRLRTNGADPSTGSGRTVLGFFDGLPSTGFLRRASFDRLPSTGSGRAGGGAATGFLRQAQQLSWIVNLIDGCGTWLGPRVGGLER